MHLPIRAAAAMAPALAPAMLLSRRKGANSCRQEAAPTWYNPMNPHPAKDMFMLPKNRGST